MAMPEILQPAWEARQSNTDEAEELRQSDLQRALGGVGVRQVHQCNGFTLLRRDDDSSAEFGLTGDQLTEWRLPTRYVCGHFSDQHLAGFCIAAPDEAEELRRNNGLDDDYARLTYALGWLRAMREDPYDGGWRENIGRLLAHIDDGRGLKR